MRFRHYKIARGSAVEVAAAFEALAGTHPLLCRLTGSGSAFLAVYRTERDRADAVMMLGRKHGRVLETTAGG